MTDQNDNISLVSLRDQIDEIDQQIGDLISARAQCAIKVAEVKKRESGGQPINFYRPEREAQVLRKAMERNQGPLSDEEFARLFREIMSACLALENPIKVAYLGPEGTYTQQAALKHFGHSAVAVALSAIDEVFREVESGAAQYGVVPVENSSEGVVSHTLDNFVNSNVKICGEVVLRIHHHLLVSDVTKTDSISRIYSHSQSLGQCRKWLDSHFPKAERVAVSSNAEAARRVKGEWNSAAIAGQMAAELYGLTSYAQNIEDQPDNSTRFLIIGTEGVGPSNADKTSIVVSTRNEPGALYHLLEPFHQHNIDLTRVETRPSASGTWNYVFFIDFKGHADDEQVKSALAEVSANASDIKILGSYPIGVL
ncbi:prephenate dehydratase [Teredinibacter sp. KSP-S5-2]|uniref:prephenate dehydratase n=1 Tax=Teredinibacter sp. KSP-S5-2 TaxID=3034506 RepID=UPI002934E797|nr:prephenate dehydratase [Teredinibacter sp. KSP-S5-2]WNO07877.1 prephenate dehydratase [Teredinibacter sp. KSP-S5-2]